MQEHSRVTETTKKHLYVLGITGKGKSKFLEGLILQDILAGRGCVRNQHTINTYPPMKFLSGAHTVGDTLGKSGICTTTRIIDLPVFRPFP